MKICDKQLPAYFQFANHAIGEECFEYGPSTKCLANLDDHGNIRAVVVYDRITDYDCMMHIASDGTKNWMSRQYLVMAFHVPFVQWGLRRVTGLVKAGNEQALSFDKHLGFVQEGVIRCGFGDCDGILLGMLKEECRFLNRKYYGREK